MELLLKKLRENADLPQYTTAGSAGMDLRACLDEAITIAPGQRVKIPTGFAIALPGPEWAALIFARSGLATKHGLTLPNCVGVVDSDYRGEILVALTNLSDAPYAVQPGERVAQMVITPVVRPTLVETDSLPDTQRGAGGFGSTGRA